MSSLRENGKQIYGIQSLRTIACLIIFVCHAGYGPSWGLGAWGVSVFFVISGFVLVFSQWEKQTEWEAVTLKTAVLSAIKRLKKLFLLHVIMLLVGLAQEIVKTDKSFADYFFELAVTIPFLQTWFPTTYRALNSVDWYLSVTAFLYVCFPFILYFLKNFEPNIITTTILTFSFFLFQFIVGSIIVSLQPTVDIKWIIYSFPLYRLWDFLIGCFVGYCYLSFSNSRITKTGATIAESIIIAAIVISFTLYKRLLPMGGIKQAFAMVTLFLPSSVALVYFFAVGKGYLSRILTNRITLMFAGITSYFFLIHRLMLSIVRVCINYFRRGDNNLLVMLVAFVLSVIASILYRSFNEMVIKRKKGLT